MSITRAIIREIEEKRTMVLQKGDVKVYAMRKVNGSSLKEEIEIRVVCKEIISNMFEVSLIGEINPEKAYREIVGCAGLDLKDIKMLGHSINKKYNEIKISTTEEIGVIEAFEILYELLEDRGRTSDQIKNEDINLNSSILIQDGCYMLKAGVLRDLAEEIEVSYTDLKKELVSLGFVKKGNGRDAVGVSLNNKKMKLIKIKRDKFRSMFRADDELAEVVGV